MVISFDIYTGMRLSEGGKVSKEDLKVKQSIPYVDIKPHSWLLLRPKAVLGVPLVGASLWSARRILESNNDSSCLSTLYQ